MPGKFFCFGLLMLMCLLVSADKLVAQMAVAPTGARPSPEQIEQMRAMHKARNNSGPTPGQKPKSSEDGKKKDDDKDKKKDDGKKEEEAKVVKRPIEPPQPANPEELKVTPDDKGRVQFNFRFQPWADVLQWFADVASYSFDWQELPDGFLNLTTHRKYTLPETRDLLNRHLLARGFTMVLQGEVLTVVKISKLDPSLVPRGDADELEDFAPHDFLRVRFSLPLTMDPKKAADDVKILLSPNAKVTPLLASKRLLVIDAVANLRDVRDLLYAEQMASDRIIKPREFLLKYRRADYVADQVMVVLGLDPATRKSPQELQLEQQKMQMMMKMQQKGKDVSKLLSKDGPPVYIAVNQRQNSLLINAPADLMPTIERTIRLFDRPDGAGSDWLGANTPGPNGTGLASQTGSMTMEKYQTVTASTDKVIEALQEIAQLAPTTQLSSDSENKTIFAYAAPVDHAKIQKMVDRLDGSGRRAEMRWLRKLSADQVAGTLTALLVGEEKKKEPSRSGYFGFFGFNRSNKEKKPQVGFKALADVEHNRLLLWVNDSELAEVDKILEQLGEVPGRRNPRGNKVRVLNARDPEEAARLLRRLENSWSGKNRLRIHTPPETPKSSDSPANEEEKPSDDKNKPDPAPVKKDQVASRGSADFFDGPNRNHPWSIRFAMLSERSKEEPSEGEQSDKATRNESTQGQATGNQTEHSDQAPPIDVIVMPDGRILLQGGDPAALDELEDLLNELAPPQDKFAVFDLHNASASLVVLNLEEYFEDELNGQMDAQYTYYGSYRGTKKRDTGPISLSARPLLRFIYDFDTNTIVVQNASPAQLRTIRKLIEIYDRPINEDSVMARRTEAIKIRYSKAADIANAVKEVYRDLLSSKDKEFQGKNGQGKLRTETHYRFYGSGPSDDKKKPAAVKVAFEGVLSIGVDELSNTLIISAQEDVWDKVRELVISLDEAAMPRTVVQVHEVRGIVSTDALQKALSKALGSPWPGGKPQQAAGQKGGKGKGEKQPDEGSKGKEAGGKKSE